MKPLNKPPKIPFPDSTTNHQSPTPTPTPSPDPELKLEAMRETAQNAASDLIPILVEKAINGKTKDALAIFESLADRTGFAKPPEAASQPNSPLFNLNINPTDVSNLLGGLKTITQSPLKIEDNTDDPS